MRACFNVYVSFKIVSFSIRKFFSDNLLNNVTVHGVVVLNTPYLYVYVYMYSNAVVRSLTDIQYVKI